MSSVHIPILAEPILRELTAPFLTASAGHLWVDCTLGGGGHTGAFLQRFSELGLRHRVVAFDQDPDAIARASERFRSEIGEGRLELHHARFSDALELLGDRPVLGMLADLGFSSDQMGDPARGLSFSSEGPLDMRLDPTRGQTARQLLQQWPEREIERVLSEYGEERFARRIASLIVERRRERALPDTARGFAELVVKAIPPGARHQKIHAATRSFQALRIAVNEELKELDTLLEHVIMGIQPGGRVAILSFHSLEDRKVKSRFKDRAGPFRPLTKKPLEAGEEELRSNPRARSAKLRMAERVK